MTLNNDSLFQVTTAHIQSATRILTQVFQETPLWVHFIPDESTRREKIHYLFELVLCYGIRYGHVIATSPNLESILVWLPPGEPEMTLWGQLLCGMVPLAFRMGLRLSLRQLKISNYMSAAHKRLAPPRHAYILIVGTAPQLQGQGYASKLFRPLFDQLDRERMPCFLETHQDKNIPIYQHYGFQILEETTFPGSQVKNIAMLRLPR